LIKVVLLKNHFFNKLAEKKGKNWERSRDRKKFKSKCLRVQIGRLKRFKNFKRQVPLRLYVLFL